MTATISRRLADLRELLALPTAEAAAAAGLSPEELLAIEDGARRPDDLQIRRLASAFGVSVAYFTEPDDERRDEGVLVLGRLAGELTGHDRDEALRFAAYLRHTTGA